MIKFEHSIFALPFAYLGLFLALENWPTPQLFMGITVAMISFRTMGMGLNRLIDKDIDARNPRTQNRALPQGRLKLNFVWAVTALSFFIFEFTALKLGRLCFFLSPIPVALAWIYPYTKRFTWSCHFVLGILLGIAPYGAWLAGGREFSWTAGFLMLGVASWVAGFDILYALQDLEFDQRNGLHSFPARFGFHASLQAVGALHASTLLFWYLAGTQAGLGLIYRAGLGIIALLLVREHAQVRKFGIAKINETFFTANARVSLSIFLMVLLDLIRTRSGAGAV
ncbi:MAG: 4-hydroxybenzoate octaprenyltransferase [Candidatus Omnitrophica bacterium]|nr:4-hydroxybenzoate octaprenyltransferase [Candidatus Omnitrophota bacterium]